MNGIACSGGDFTQSVWVDAQLRKADFSGANLEQCMFHRTQCAGAVFPDARLAHADFSYADLRDADLRTATLMRTKVHRTLLENTRFSDRGGLLQNDPALFAAEEFSARRPKHRGERGPQGRPA
jgi:uncharacterized protein YjbI with pentapeptide repeats